MRELERFWLVLSFVCALGKVACRVLESVSDMVGDWEIHVERMQGRRLLRQAGTARYRARERVAASSSDGAESALSDSKKQQEQTWQEQPKTGEARPSCPPRILRSPARSARQCVRLGSECKRVGLQTTRRKAP